MKHFVITLVDESYNSHKLFTTEDALEKVEKKVRDHDLDCIGYIEAYLNHADICFDGYLITGDYIKRIV